IAPRARRHRTPPVRMKRTRTATERLIRGLAVSVILAETAGHAAPSFLRSTTVGRGNRRMVPAEAIQIRVDDPCKRRWPLRRGSDGGGPSMTDGYAGKDGKRPHERPIFDRARAAADQKPQPEKRHRSRSVDRIAGGGPR